MNKPSDWKQALHAWWQELAEFPWRQMGGVLWRRFQEARLGVTASSLTFTTLLAMVPLFTVGLAVFSAFPVFGKFQDTLQRWLIDSLVPESIARQVLGYLTLFSRKASRLGSVGLVAVLVSAIALMLTIERTLGQIWRIERPRRVPQRVLLFWSALTLGPLLLGGSLAITSFVASASQDMVEVLPGGVRWLLDGFEFFLLVLCVSGLYYYVPNAPVRWRHAFTAGLMAALGLELAKNLLALWLTRMPSYSAIYGAFAAVPILLVWVYTAWVIVLLGAVVASSLPELGRQQLRQPSGAGWALRLALEVLAALLAARDAPQRGLSQMALAEQLHIHPRELDRVLQSLQSLDWVGPLREQDDPQADRWVLLVDPAHTLFAPLAESLLLSRSESSRRVWPATGLDKAYLVEVLPL